MRALFLIAALGLALAACRGKDQVDNSLNLDENLAAENIASNDVTAIDAVTGEDSNMAADVPLDNSLDNVVANAGDGAARPKGKPAKPAPAAASHDTAPAATNSAAPPAAGNTL